MTAKANVASCEVALLYERGKFRTSYCDFDDLLGADVIGATVFEIDAGYTRAPYHFHDGVEEWMYVVAGEPMLRDPSGIRVLKPGTLVTFQAGPDGAHNVDGPGRIVMFSAGARGWGEAFTTVYLDADKIGGKPGIQFIRKSALETWREPAVTPITKAAPGPCPEIDLLTCAAESASLAARLHTQLWTPSLYELAAGEATDAYHYDWCREHWALVLTGTPTLRHPGGSEELTPGDIMRFPEGEAGARQFLNGTDKPSRIFTCSAPASGPSAAVYPDDETYVLRVPGQTGFRFSLADQLRDYWDGEPGALER